MKPVTASLAVTMVLLLASQALATREITVALADRLREFEAVIVGTVVSTEVEQDGELFMPMMTLRVSEKIWVGQSTGPVRRGDMQGGTMRVELGPWTTRAAAEVIAASRIPSSKGVWFLVADSASSGLRMGFFTPPAAEQNWEAYLESLRERAKEATALAPLQMSVIVEPGTVTQSVPFQATVLVYSIAELQLPEGLPISLARVWLSDQPDWNSTTLGDVPSWMFGQPVLRVLNMRPVSEMELPRRLAPGVVYAARMTLQIGQHEESLGQFTIHAKLTGPRHMTLAVAAPVRVRVLPLPEDEQAVVRKLDAGDRLWQFMGPHQLRMSTDQERALDQIMREHPNSILAPPIRCGLIFPKQPSVISIISLEELSRMHNYGWSMDCLAQVHKFCKQLLAAAPEEASGENSRAELKQYADSIAAELIARGSLGRLMVEAQVTTRDAAEQAE